METVLDFIGGFFWILMLVGPFIIIPLTFKFIKNKPTAFLIGIATSALVSFASYWASIEIIFRHGMGS